MSDNRLINIGETQAKPELTEALRDPLSSRTSRLSC